MLQAICLIVFDIIRKRLWWIYEPRPRHPGYTSRTPEAPPAHWLGWLYALVKNYNELRDEDLFEKYGIDAVMLLILTRFGVKSCAFACILGLACLLPIYLTANNHNIRGFRSATLATCLMDPEANSSRLWIAVAAAWFMTAHALFSLGELYNQFIQLRHRYFVKRALDCERDMDMTPGLTLMLENLPPHLRESDDDLKAYFEKLFPGDVFCVRTVKQNTQKMESIVESFETIQQFESDLPGEDTLQCRWRCGQPHRCMCCLCGQPGVCTCASENCAGCYEEALPALDTAKTELMEKMIEVRDHYDRRRVKSGGSSSNWCMWWVSLCNDAGGAGGEVQESLLSGAAHGAFGVTKIDITSGAAVEVYKSASEAAESCGGRDLEGDIIQCCEGELPAVKNFRWRWAFVDEKETMYHRNIREVAIKPWEKACKRETQGRAAASKTKSDYRGSGVRTANRRRNNAAAASTSTSTSGSGNGNGGGNNIKNLRSRLDAMDDDIAALDGEEAESCVVSVYQWIAFVAWRFVQIFYNFFAELLSLLASALDVFLVAMNCRSSGTVMSGTAFITFKKPTALATALQLRLDRHPQMMKTTQAPEKRDIYWNNIAVPQDQVESRIYIANVLLLAGVVFWSGIVALCSTLPRQLKKWFNYDSSGESAGAIMVREYLPVLALLGLLNLLPLLFKILAIAFEKRKLQSEVDISVVRRFFDYQMANVYVALVAGSMADGLTAMVTQPLMIFEMFSESVASQAAFFFNFLVFKMCMSPLWLLRTWPLVSRGWVPPRASVPAEVPSVPYGWAYPKQIVVMLIVYTYWVICPLMLPVALVTCVAHDLFFRYLIIYGHMPHYESGGQFWYLTFDRICASLCIGSFLMAIVMAYKATMAHFLVLLPLPFVVYKFNQMAYTKYYLPSKERALSEIVEDDKFLRVFKERWNVKIEDRLNPDLYVQPSFSVFSDVLDASQHLGESSDEEEDSKKKKKRRGRSISVRPIVDFGVHHVHHLFGWMFEPHDMWGRTTTQPHHDHDVSVDGKDDDGAGLDPEAQDQLAVQLDSCCAPLDQQPGSSMVKEEAAKSAT